jgi:transcriptional regulator with XRE-family HTH domain
MDTPGRLLYNFLRARGEARMDNLNLGVFGARLRSRRRQLHLTQQALAQQMHVAQGWISELENARQTRLEADTVYRFCKALTCSADYLLGLTETPQLTARKRQRTRKAVPVG